MSGLPDSSVITALSGSTNWLLMQNAQLQEMVKALRNEKLELEHYLSTPATVPQERAEFQTMVRQLVDRMKEANVWAQYGDYRIEEYLDARL